MTVVTRTSRPLLIGGIGEQNERRGGADQQLGGMVQILRANMRMEDCLMAGRINCDPAAFKGR